MKIREIKNKIKETVSLTLLDSGFTFYHFGFYCHATELIKVIHLQHFDTNMASQLGTNTASFSIRLGIFYNFIPLQYEIARNEDKGVLLPKEYECHIRRTLLRDFKQEAKGKDPLNIDRETKRDILKYLEKFPNLKPKKNNQLFTDSQDLRDIWYVENDGSNLDIIIEGIKRVIFKEGMKWFEKFSDFTYTYKYLRQKQENDYAFNFGTRDSPARNYLLGYFARRLGKEKEAKVYLSKAKNLVLQENI